MRTMLVEDNPVSKHTFEIVTEWYSGHSALTEADKRRILTAVEKHDIAGLKGLVMNLFKALENNGCTGMMLEFSLKQMVQLLERHYRRSNTTQVKILEVRIEELIYSCSSFTELADNFFALLVNFFKLSDPSGDTGASMQLFSRIETYITTHIGQPISLQVLINQFHVSRTVLCNLFRDYSGKSFVEYITSLRMKVAQQLMKDYPEMLNKEIAEIIGYTDQNYFSHVFKIITEMSPTKFREQLAKNTTLTLKNVL